MSSHANAGDESQAPEPSESRLDVDGPQPSEHLPESEHLGRLEEIDEDGPSGESALSILDEIVKRSKGAINATSTLESTIPGKTADEQGSGIQEDTDLMNDLENAFTFLKDSGSAGTQQDPTFIRMRSEYDKIHKLFMQSRKNEKLLMKKCRELTQELSSNASKVLAALKLSQNDRTTMISLRKEIKKAWAMVESANEKENRSKDAVASLKVELESVRTTLAEAGVNTAAVPTATGPVSFGRNRLLEMQMEQEESIRKLRVEIKTLEEQLARVNQENQFLQSENSQCQEKNQTLIEDKMRTDEEVLTLKDLLSTKKSEQDREFRIREKVESALRQATDASARKDTDLANKVSEIKLIRDQMTRLESSLREERQKVEKTEKEIEHTNAKMIRSQQEYEEQVQATMKLMGENQKHSSAKKDWEEELAKFKDDLKMVTRARDGLSKRMKLLEEVKATAELERDELKSKNVGLAHDIENIKKELEFANKQVETLSRDRDVTQKNLVKQTGITQKQVNISKLGEQTQRNLEQEIQGFKDEATKMRKLIFSLEKERDYKIAEMSKIEESLIKKDEDVKMKELMIFDSKKKVTELERKLKEQQTMYETVRTDRNLYSKNLVEAQDEIIEMKRKLKIMSHQIEQLKEEIATKENALIKEHFEHTKLEKEKEALSGHIAKIQNQFKESQQMIQNQEAEENKLRHIIAEADAERMRQKKEYNAVVQERDILGTQLIRRNDELSLLYEKIKIQASTLNKGELQYRVRLEDIRVLKLEIKKLRREKAILQTETQNVSSLRSEIFRLQREELRERTRVKVLEEELESPMNIHRWRKLSGSDPSTFELITKIQTLQKRLIAKTEEVVENELVIQQKEKLYKDIKDVLQRQPGPEVLEELRVVKEAVKVKIRESKALASELNMYHSQVNEYKYEIERLNREIQDLKKKYFEQRKKGLVDKKMMALADKMKQKLGTVAFERLICTPGTNTVYQIDSMSRRDDMEVKAILPQLPHGPKFSGGGFNMTSGTKSRASIHPPREISPSDGQSVAGVSVAQQVHNEETVTQERTSSAPLVQVPSAVEESGSVVT